MKAKHKPAGFHSPRGFSQVFRKSVLPGGACAVTEHIPESLSLALGVWVKTGSRSEKPGQGGSAHFIEHLVFKGTGTRSAASLAREIDSIGGHLDAFTSREYTCFYLKLLAEHVEQGMDILSDILYNSTFPPLEIDRERKVVLEEIKMSEDNPEDVVYELLLQGIWPRNPLGRPILGPARTIGAISRDDLVAYFRRHYSSSNLVMAAAGGIDHETLEGLWRRYFPSKGEKRRTSRHSPPRFYPGVYRRERELEQTHIAFGTRGLPQTHSDRYTLYLLNSILGGTMSSRLFQEIREKRGLAYSVYSSHSSYRDTGLFSVSVSTSPRHVKQVKGLIEKQLHRLTARQPSAAEVALVRNHIKGNLILSLESTGSRMMSIAKQEIYFGRQFGVDETIRGIDAVRPAHILNLARKMFRSEFSAWSAVGPEKSLKVMDGGKA